MKKESYSRFLFVSLILIFYAIYPVSACYSGQELDSLLEERSCHVWIDGQVLGDMVIGARAQVVFVIVDNDLVNVIKKDHSAPEWLAWHINHFGSSPEGDVLFIVRYKTFKFWDFEPSDIYVDNYVINFEDIVTRKEYLLIGSIPPDTEGTFAFFAPLENEVGKEKIILSCGGYSCSIEYPESMR